jgi:hypothetical protein
MTARDLTTVTVPVWEIPLDSGQLRRSYESLVATNNGILPGDDVLQDDHPLKEKAKQPAMPWPPTRPASCRHPIHRGGNKDEGPSDARGGRPRLGD